MSELSREQAEWASQVMGLRYRNRKSGKVQQVTDVVPCGKGGVRVVLNGRVNISPSAFLEGWGNGGQGNKANNSGT